jgi:hypothetical protein
MARNKINFAAQGLYVGPSPATGLHFEGTGCGTLSGDLGETLVKELYRIQGVDYSFNFEKENVAAFGDLAPIDYAATTAPTVNLNFNYLVSNFINEKNIGFTISSGQLVNALSGIIQTEEDRNYFLAIHGVDGEDLHNNPNYNYNSNGNIIGFGNGVINNYSFNVAVGQFPTVSVGVEALNIVAYDKQASLFTTLMENAGGNGNFDIVNTGGALFKNDYFQNWDIGYNESSLVKIVPDPVNISNAINQDLMIINRPSGNAYFTSSTTGATDWHSASTNANSGYVFINTGTQQLVLRKLGVPPVNQYFQATNSSGAYNPRLSSGVWYKLTYDLASSPDIISDIRFGGSNEIITYIRTGINTAYLFSTGANNNGLLIVPYSNSGDYVFNSIELFIPQNYSARYYATGSTGTSINLLTTEIGGSVYNSLNAPKNLNRRYKYSFDLKYSGFESSNYGTTNSKNFSYYRLGLNSNSNFAGGRFPRVDTSYSGQFKNIELEMSNSPNLDGSFSPGINNVRLFHAPDGEFWIDNAKLVALNQIDIINGNIGNGSFEIYHPNSANTGVLSIQTFSGWIFYQDPLYTPYAFVTGDTSSLPSYDSTKTYSQQSFKVTLTKTGAGSRYFASSSPTYNGQPARYVANKRHKISYYTKYSGVGANSRIRIMDANNEVYHTQTLNNNNSWDYIEHEFIPTGAAGTKFELTFGTTAITNDSIWLDDINLYYYDDCYELPVVQDVAGGFGLPINPTTNYSGLSTNNNLKSLSVLNPKDAYLNINYNDLGVNVTGWKLQSINLDLPLNREKIYKMGQPHPDYRLLFPIIGNVTLNAITDDLVSGDLYNHYFNCNKNYDLSFGIESPCNANQGINFVVRKAKLNGLSFNNNINGLGQDVTMDFIYTIPNPTATGQGLFMSGITDLS